MADNILHFECSDVADQPLLGLGSRGFRFHLLHHAIIWIKISGGMKMRYISLIFSTLLVFTLPLWGETLFFDDFEDGKIGDAYQFSGIDFPQSMIQGKPVWEERDGVFSQTSTNQGDPCHAVIADKEYPDILTIQAKVRIDKWADGDGARGGVALRVELPAGEGYNLLFHNNTSTLQFLHDRISWGKSTTFNFEPGKWYWFQLHIDGDGILHGKVWADGEAEPKNWMLEQNIQELGAPIREKGYPALNGGVGGRAGQVTISFDEVEVWDQNGPSPRAVRPGDKLPICWGEIKTRR